jgi:sortase (surface protein transpeptidase)
MILTCNPRGTVPGRLPVETDLLEANERVLEGGGDGRWSRAPEMVKKRENSAKNEQRLNSDMILTCNPRGTIPGRLPVEANLFGASERVFEGGGEGRWS